MTRALTWTFYGAAAFLYSFTIISLGAWTWPIPQ